MNFGPSSQRADPHVAEMNRVAVVLEVDRPLLGDGVGRGGRRRLPANGDVVLNQHAVVQNRERAGLDLAVGQFLGS